MIAGATRGTGGGALARHLLARTKGQTVRVLEARHLVAADLRAQLRELVDSARRGRTSKPVHHLHIDPPPGSDAAAVTEKFVTLYEKEFGLEDVQRLGVEHVKDGRAHHHLVYSLVRPDGRVADLSHDFKRREKISRVTEFECGLEWTKGKHNRAVAQALRTEGRGDVADAMEAAGLLDGRRPIAVQTPRERAQAERTAVPVADVRQALLDAWQSSDDGPSFAAALQEHGLRLAAGEKAVLVVDRAGGPHALTRHLSAAAGIAGSRIVASDIKKRLHGLTLPTTEELNERLARSPEAERLPGDLDRSPRSASDERETVAAPDSPGSRGRGPAGGNQGSPRNDREHLGPALRVLGRTQGQPRAAQRVAAARLGGLDVAALQAKADGIRLRPVRRMVQSRAAVARLSGLDLTDLRARAAATAGGRYRHPEKQTNHREDNAMKGLKPIRGLRPAHEQKFKAGLLADIAPHLDAGPWQDDIYQVNRGGPSVRPRIQTRDRGWVEVDRKAGLVRSFGKSGRAQELAQAIAEAEGLTPVHAAPSGDVRNVGSAGPHHRRMDSVTLENWWRERGYDAVAARDGVWVDAGASRIQDTGDQMRLHGPLTAEAARALILKAGEAWGGQAELTGNWSAADQDALWLSAQRSDVRLEGCTPSDRVRRMWADEQAAAAERQSTLASVGDANRLASTVLKAATGDAAALRRLEAMDRSLSEFVTSYLDDDDRAELSSMEPVDVIPELGRFRKLGEEELTRHGRNRAPETREQWERNAAPPAKHVPAEEGRERKQRFSQISSEDMHDAHNLVAAANGVPGAMSQLDESLQAYLDSLGGKGERWEQLVGKGQDFLRIAEGLPEFRDIGQGFISYCHQENSDYSDESYDESDFEPPALRHGA